MRARVLVRVVRLSVSRCRPRERDVTPSVESRMHHVYARRPLRRSAAIRVRERKLAPRCTRLRASPTAVSTFRSERNGENATFQCCDGFLSLSLSLLVLSQRNLRRGPGGFRRRRVIALDVES